MSIGSHLVADGGTAVKKLNLFRGAIMESGAPSGFVYLSRKFLVIAKFASSPQFWRRSARVC